MRTTIAAFIVSAAFLLPLGPATTGAWAQPTLNAELVRTRVFGNGFLISNGISRTCFGVLAESIVATNSSGPIFSHQKGHLCTLDNCTKDQFKADPTVCGLEGAVDLSCKVMTFASDCSQITLVCLDQNSNQSFHTLGQGRANPAKPPLEGFLDGVSLAEGVINIVHNDSQNPDLDCGQRLGPTR